MPWMRVSIGLGGLATAAGVVGMLLWIDDGSHYFDLAVAVAMAGFLTLGSCVLTRVFGSSHGSQDDAFRRGKSMGYDEGFLEGHRSARPVVVPLRSVDRDLEATVADVQPDDEPQAPSAATSTVTAAAPRWRREARESRDRSDGWVRVIPWARARRTPLLVGAVSLALLCALGVSELRRPVTHTEALQQSPGRLFYQSAPPLGSTPALVRKTGQAPARLAAVAGVSPVAPAAAPGSSVLHAGEAANPLGLPVAVAAPGTISQLVAASPGTAPVVAPAVAPVAPVAPVSVAPVVPLTAAEQTAADAKAAADLTAANAAAAAAETARVAAAAAEATRLQALADAYAVAHPGG